jgi:hypothetical protein
MRLPRRITLDMPVAHSSPANTAASLEPRHFGMWSWPASRLPRCTSLFDSMSFRLNHQVLYEETDLLRETPLLNVTPTKPFSKALENNLIEV